MDKALSCLSLARKAGLVELGEEPVSVAARAHRAKLVLVAADASEHTWQRCQSFVAGTKQQCVRVPYSKEQLGLAVGRSVLAQAAFTDPSLALTFLKALDEPQRYEAVAADLAQKVARVKQQRREEKKRCGGKSGGPRASMKNS